MVDDLMSHLSISANIQELDSVRKLDNLMDVDQPKGDFKASPEDLYDSEYDNKYVDSLSSEVNNDNLNTETTAAEDCIAEVKKAHIDAGFVEPSAMSLSKTKSEDIRVQFSADVSLSKHDFSTLQEHCREIDANDVKDICMDEGLPVKEKIHAEDIFKGPKHTVDTNYAMKDEEFGSKKEKMDADWPIPVGLKSSIDMTCEKDFNRCESKPFFQQNESEHETKKLVLRDFLKDKVVEEISVCNTAALDSQLNTSLGNGCKDKQDRAHKDAFTESEVAPVESRLSSPTSEEKADVSKIETSVTKTEPETEAANKSSHPTAVKNKDEKIASSVDHPQPPDAAHMLQRLGLFLNASDHLTASEPLQRDHFESSFASAGYYTGSITYSGPIAHSGSLSHRSDASTVSTRSFAFPVLKNEWNFSPVRMQKADRRHLRRHRGWMHGLFCCKF